MQGNANHGRPQKGVTYKLALLYERMGDKKSYLERLKEIYDADYGYSDVAKRVESSYEQESAEAPFFPCVSLFPAYFLPSLRKPYG